MTFQSIDRAVTRVANAVAVLLDVAIGAVVAGLLAVVASQIVDRNWWPMWRDSPEEYVKIGLVWLCFLGIVRAFATGEVIRITFVYDWLPVRLRRAVDILFDLVLLAVLSVLVAKSWMMIQAAQFQMILGTDFTLDVPAYALLVGFGLLVPLIGWRLVRTLVGADGAPPEAPPTHHQEV